MPRITNKITPNELKLIDVALYQLSESIDISNQDTRNQELKKEQNKDLKKIEKLRRKISELYNLQSEYVVCKKTLHRFVHEYNCFKDGTKADAGWWEIIGTKCVNECGGRHDFFDKGSEIVEAEDFEDLYKKLGKKGFEYLIDKESPYGWLSPEGDWFPCKYYDHSQLAKRYLGYSEEELERKGWVKITAGMLPGEKLSILYQSIKITDKQRVALENMGIDTGGIF